jgi:ABC-2 type transport system permease protein
VRAGSEERATLGTSVPPVAPIAAGAATVAPVGRARAAPFSRLLARQTAVELRLSLRRGESLLVTFIIPCVLLVFFLAVPPTPLLGVDPLDYLLPGTLALAVMAAGLPNLGIATAYERGDGVLKRLGATPLTRAGLVLAKLLALVVLEAAQVAVLVAIAMLNGWRPPSLAALGLALVVLLLGTAAFAGLGLLIAGALRPEATLAGANALFLLMLPLGGLYVPLNVLPPWMAAVGSVLPAAALAESLRGVLQPAPALSPSAFILLLAWAVAAPVAAALAFQWDY